MTMTSELQRKTDARERANALVRALHALRARKPGELTAHECAVLLDAIEDGVDVGLIESLREQIAEQRAAVAGVGERLQLVRAWIRDAEQSGALDGAWAKRILGEVWP